MAWTARTKKHDDEIIIGDTWIRDFGLESDSAGTAFSIAGATGTCEINTQADGAGTALATPTISLVTDGTDGQFRVTLAAATTATLTAQRAYYSIRLTFADSTKATPVEGVVTIRSSVV